MKRISENLKQRNMKKIFVVLLLLSICSISYSQIEVSFDKKKASLNGADLITMRSLFAYKKECENDSIGVKYDIYKLKSGELITISTEKRIPDLQYVKSIIVYEQAKPNFEGFLEYLYKNY